MADFNEMTLKEKRESLGLRAEDLAHLMREKTGKGSTTIVYRWERNDKIPKVDAQVAYDAIMEELRKSRGVK